MRMRLGTLPCSVLLASFLINFGQAQNPEWSRPFGPVRIVGNLYYVGTYDLSSYLITTPEGHFLVNTGLEDSAEPIRENIAALGFDLDDVKILLEMQAHFDHVAALAKFKRDTGAKLYATAGDRPLLKRGDGFETVETDKVITHGEVIELGGVQVTVIATPGHTRGSTSFRLNVDEGGKTYRVMLANMGTVIPGMNLVDDADYPRIADDFRLTFERQRAEQIDIWTAAHGSQFGLHDKYQPGDAYGPDRFVDPDGYRKAVDRHEAMFQQKLAEQRAAKR